jgi:hypothetical protein
MSIEERKAARERSHQHGNVFSSDSGAMLIHMQRESGLAHRTLTLRPWQVQLLRVLTSKWFISLLAIVALSWMYFAVQTARVPFLNTRISRLEEDARRLDTLQLRLTQLQARYDQVQKMLSAPGASAGNPEGGRAVRAPGKGTADEIPAEWVSPVAPKKTGQGKP